MMKTRSLSLLLLGLMAATVSISRSSGEEGRPEAELARVPVYHVAELTFAGPRQRSADTPARDVEFSVLFRHESGRAEVRVLGFWDGDGRGGSTGSIFKVRFCPTRQGTWRLAEVRSSAPELKGQREGAVVVATPSKHPGFWEVDRESPGGRWYRRSDGSHPYIVGNTAYTFLSGYKADSRPSGVEVRTEITRQAAYFKKLRFSLHGDRYPNPEAKPFLDAAGRPTEDGDFSCRPNPTWFGKRVDAAVEQAFREDLVADLILAGPDMEASRATLRAGANRNDPTPYLRYIAARYGSYPNVWICLCNEYDIRTPKYTEAEIARFGQAIRAALPYPTPLSVHASPRPLWSEAFDALSPWNDHQIVQQKLRQLGPAADVILAAWKGSGSRPRNRPTINDELSYEGAGDRHSEGDTIEAHLGAFLGGGYGTTGFKPGNKLGHYFWGNFTPEEHTSADNLRFLRRVIDREIAFWKLAPDTGIFRNLDPGYRGMAWPEREYVLGTNRARTGIVARLPAGRWRVTRHDLIAQQTKVMNDNAAGEFRFDAPESRAVLFHFRRK
jgi:hypothetical protein